MMWETKSSREDADQASWETSRRPSERNSDQFGMAFLSRDASGAVQNLSALLKSVPLAWANFENYSIWGYSRFDHRLSLEQKELALKKLAYSLLTGESVGIFYERNNNKKN